MFTNAWIKAMDEIHSLKYLKQVVYDIDSHPDIKERVKDFRESFIKFACLERMNFVPDIYDELECFLKRNRSYSIDMAEYKRLKAIVFKRDNYTCRYCGQVGGKLEADHVIPISKGGANDLDNLVTSCRKCNRQKHDKDLDSFLEWKRSHE
jgi:5-methylcytosine-specific restriction endonuclease McrA